MTINAAATQLLKDNIHEMRPDRSGNDSWPSRHTSWATAGAVCVSRELYRQSPWWVLGSQAMVNGVMLQRVFSEAHFPKDVLSGMALGMLSAQAGYSLTELAWPSSVSRRPDAVNVFEPAFDITTAAIIPFTGGTRGTTLGLGLNTALRATLPMSDNWGIALKATTRTMPLYDKAGDYFAPLGGFGLAMGSAYYITLPPRRWSAEARADVGLMYNHCKRPMECPRLSPTLDMTAGASYSLTPACVVGLEAGYMVWGTYRYVTAATVGFFTRASF